ncbi:anti-sigma factor domain-containing protein [Nonomuraea sp. NEAU-A123]|uniref:anti-sigma factor n=1 Tax=Nonomuraea sp. NEAU-A123 TaxID=2839649 RepID=UPI001BE4710F|nr:anti-sigma factor [Nonomuraea sp. NEAU-A123]MBT2226542.1 anti-sigma factor [Nonomuraea sp. NEAU-A123]
MRGTTGGSDPHTLVGAYALDAIDDEIERHRFEDHLAGCPDCTLEIAGFAETAARLGSAVAIEPPPALKDRVFAQIDQVRQAPPTVAEPTHGDQSQWQPQRRPEGWAEERPVGRSDEWSGGQPAGRSDEWSERRPAGRSEEWAERRAQRGLRRRPEGRARRRSRWRPLVAAVGVAACLAAVAVLGATALRARDELEQVRRTDREVAAVLTAPDSRTATASARQGGRGTVVVSRSRGKMVFLAAGLADLPEGSVYQLWQLAPGQISSAGLLTADAAGHMLPVITAPGPGVAKIGVTVEPAGGSTQPTTKPLFLVNLPTT